MNIDQKLLNLANAFKKGDWRTRRLYRGKAQALINKTYTDKQVIADVWAEWESLANKK